MLFFFDSEQPLFRGVGFPISKMSNKLTNMMKHCFDGARMWPTVKETNHKWQKDAQKKRLAKGSKLNPTQKRCL